MSQRFSHFLAVDWSGAKGTRQKGIALAVAAAEGGSPVLIAPPDPKGWARAEVLALLGDLPGATLVGLDLGIGLPFADENTGNKRGHGSAGSTGLKMGQSC